MKRFFVFLILLVVVSNMAAFAEAGVLQNGDSGGAINTLQKTLSALDYLSEEYVTGDYDDMTELAVLAFQLDHSLSPTGTVDATTQKAIMEALHNLTVGPSTEQAVEAPQTATEVNEPSKEKTQEAPTIPTEDIVPLETEAPLEQETALNTKKTSIEIKNEEIRIEDGSEYSDLIDVFYVAELINNTDVPILIDDLSLDLEDENGSLLLTRNTMEIFPSVIMPGKSGFIHEKVSGFYGDEGFNPKAIASPMLHFKKEERPNFKFMDCTVSDIIINDDKTWPRVTCRIKNNTNFDLDDQIIAALLFDTNGRFLTCFYTYESISANEKKGYELFDLAGDSTISIANATAEVYIYDSYIR